MGKDTKHLLICNHDATKEYYMCNQACNTTPSKCVKEAEKVTCKNCLKHLARKNPYCTLKKYKVIDG